MDPDTARAFVRRFLDALEAFDPIVVGAHLHDDVVHVEHPNALVPTGITRDKAAMLRSLASGRKTLHGQRYELQTVVVTGDVIAFEAAWSGTLAIALGGTPAGATIHAAFAVFFTIDQGLVRRWHNYDCFAPV